MTVAEAKQILQTITFPKTQEERALVIAAIKVLANNLNG